jgi:tetratricopeptide (TPR) repeat protein
VGVVRYRFTHAFFRQTLYEEMIAPQRLKLHQQVARALESQYARRLEEHAAELAEHFSQSTDPADLNKAIAYGELAAKRAIDVYAYGEGVRLLEQALKVQKVLDPDDKAKQCDLLLDLVDAMSLAGESRRALDTTLPEAFVLAETISDNPRASRACMLALICLLFYGGGWTASFSTPEAARWFERADRFAGPDTLARAFADVGMGELKCIAGINTIQYTLLSEGALLIGRALELARSLGDRETFSLIACGWLNRVRAPQHKDKRLRLAEELAGLIHTGMTTRQLGLALFLIGDVFLESGQRQRGEECFNEQKEIAMRSGQSNLLLLSMVGNAAMAALDGRLEDAVAISRKIRARGEELGLSEFGAVEAYVAGLTPLLKLGKADEAFQLHDNMPLSAKALCLAHLGRDSEAGEILDKLVMARRGIGSAEDEMAAPTYTAYLETAVMVGHRPAAELLFNILADKDLFAIYFGFYFPTRQLGAAAALLERYDEARRYYQEAIKIATDMKYRPELALTRLQLAELLLEHYPKERAEALEHLDFAIKEFREMKMQPSLEHALRHKDILKA